MFRSILSSAVVGIAFFVPSLIYDSERIPQAIKVIIHMGIGYLVFFPMAIYAKWFPVDAGIAPLIGSIAFALIISIGIWFGFYLYYKHEVKLMNDRLKKED